LILGWILNFANAVKGTTYLAEIRTTVAIASGAVAGSMIVTLLPSRFDDRTSPVANKVHLASEVWSQGTVIVFPSGHSKT